MTKSSLTDLIEQGYCLHRQIADLSEQLTQIKHRLKAEALARPKEHLALTRGEGSQWIAQAAEVECRIVFPAPRLVRSLDPQEDDLEQIRALAGAHFPTFFCPLRLFQINEPNEFRAQVAARLSRAPARCLLDLCTVPSEPRATWKERPNLNQALD